MSSKFCTKCGQDLLPDNMFCPKCGTPVASPAVAQPPTQTPTQTAAQATGRRGFGGGVAMWVLVAVIIVIILVVPVFPRDTIVYVNGTTQTVTNQIQYSTAFQVYTTTTSSQVTVYTGSYQYLSSDYYSYYYDYYYGAGWGTNGCYWYHHQIVCNYQYWGPWYAPSYGTTVSITAAQQVVSVTRTQGSTGLETLTLTYYNGQSSTIQNVYSDNLTPGATTTVQSNAVVTNTITNTITTPVTQTVPCQQCIPEHVTEHVSILQMLFGY